MVNVTDQMPAEVRTFREALRAYNLAVVEWLALDPTQVYRMDVSEPAPSKKPYEPPSLVKVEWTATERQEPRVGHQQWSMSSDGEGVAYSGEVVLGFDDGEAMMAAVGPKPRMFTREQELMLKGLAAERD